MPKAKLTLVPRRKIDEFADNNEEKILVADGYDKAIVCLAQTFAKGEWKFVVIYEREACIDILCKRDGMDRDEAEEYFEFNVQGAIVDGGPIFLFRP